MISAGATLGNFQAKLGLDSTDYAKGMINADSVSRIFGQSFATFVSNPLLGSIGIMKDVGRAMISGSIEILGTAEAVQRLSQISGASEPLLIALTKRLEIAGFNAERARQGFLGLNKFMADFNNGGAASAAVLDQMGLSFDGLSGSDEIFRAVIESLSQIQSPATKAGLAARFFGEEAGPELINAISGGNDAINQMIDEYTRLGFVIDGTSNDKLAGMNTNLGFMQQAIEGITNNLLIEFLSGIADNADLGAGGIVKMAEAINESLGPAARDFGEILTIILPIISRIVSLVGRFQDGAEDIFTSIFVANDKAKAALAQVDELFDPNNPAQKRNRERFQEAMEEFGV